MRNTEKDIKKKVEETLGAFDGMHRAAPTPFFYTRMHSRLEKKVSGSMALHILSPALQWLALASIPVVILFNFYTISMISKDTASEEILSTSEQVYIEEFYPSTPTLYNTSQPVSNP